MKRLVVEAYKLNTSPWTENSFRAEILNPSRSTDEREMTRNPPAIDEGERI